MTEPTQRASEREQVMALDVHKFSFLSSATIQSYINRLDSLQVCIHIVDDVTCTFARYANAAVEDTLVDVDTARLEPFPYRVAKVFDGVK